MLNYVGCQFQLTYFEFLKERCTIMNGKATFRADHQDAASEEWWIIESYGDDI